MCSECKTFGVFASRCLALSLPSFGDTRTQSGHVSLWLKGTPAHLESPNPQFETQPFLPAVMVLGPLAERALRFCRFSKLGSAFLLKGHQQVVNLTHGQGAFDTTWLSLDRGPFLRPFPSGQVRTVERLVEVPQAAFSAQNPECWTWLKTTGC